MSTSNGSTNGHSADMDIDSLYHFWPGLTPAPQPLPEARASVNVRLVVSGREVVWTLRDHEEGRLAARLERLLAQYPAPQPPPAPASTQGEGWCPKHGLQMKWNTGKNGDKGWWSHRLPDDQGWCKGRA